MLISKNLLNFICGWSILNGFILGAYLTFASQTKQNNANKILGLFFILLTFKVAYPILFDHKTPVTTKVHAVYYTWVYCCYLSLGPVLHAYIRSATNEFRLKTQHLAYLAILIGILKLPKNFEAYKIRHMASQLWLLTFLILTLVSLIKTKVTFKKNTAEFFWFFGLTSGLFIVWIAVMFNYHMELMAFFSIMLISLAFVLFEKQNIISIKQQKYINKPAHTGLNAEKDKLLVQRLEVYMVREKPFLDPKLSLPDLSKKLNVPLHILSRVINETLGKNFSEYINAYRIDEAKKKLISEEYFQITIAGVAYDCGFNSISAFNTFFKKSTGLTPSVYRKNYSKKIASNAIA